MLFELNIYSKISGQLVSIEKFKIYFSKGVSALKSRIRSIWELSKGFLPFIDLEGIPLFHAKPKEEFLISISNRIKNKLASWSGKSLFMAGSLTLIKSMISGSFVPSFFVYKLSVSIIKDLNSCIRNFFWMGLVSEQKLISIAWHNVYKSLAKGGLGFSFVQ